MSRNNKQRRKQKQDKQRLRERKARQRLAKSQPCNRIHQAQRLIDDGQLGQARIVLEECDAAHPGQAGVLRILLDVYHEQRDYGPYVRICQRLLKKSPDDPSLNLMLAAGYLNDARMASALAEFRRFVNRWPDDPMSDGARDMIQRLEAAVEELLQDSPFPQHEQLELASLHEEVMASLASGNHQRAVDLAEQLLARSPHFIPAMNNLSQAYYGSGRSEEAIATSRRVLERDSENFHALANLARHLLLCGRKDEAGQTAQRLRPLRSENPDVWCKKAETFSYLGDDEAVLEAFDSAQRAGATSDSSPTVALLHHLAAVASARQHNDRQARRYWQRALKLAPGFSLAEENLAESKLPSGNRHGPWAYSINYWLRKETVEQLAAMLDRCDSDDEAAITKGTQRFADQHPEVAALVPELLDRGDERARQFAFRLALLVDTPPMHNALLEFCKSQRGPDAMRIQAANELSRKGVLAAGQVRLWLKGKWTDVEAIGFEITPEPMGITHPEPVSSWAYDATQALHRGDGVAAEQLLRKCLEVKGDSPDLLNNLAMALQVQDRDQESYDLLRQIHQRWPDYFFGRIGMANLSTLDGDYDAAEAYLDPLRRRSRLHTTEFAALASAYIQLWLARRNFEAARCWLAMWKEVDPDHPAVQELEWKIKIAAAVGKLSRWSRKKSDS